MACGRCSRVPASRWAAGPSGPTRGQTWAVREGVRRAAAGGADRAGPAGLGCFTVSFLVSLYYNTVLAWVLWYLLNSFQHPLPWSACPPDLNRTGTAVGEAPSAAGSLELGPATPWLPVCGGTPGPGRPMPAPSNTQAPADVHTPGSDKRAGRPLIPLN